jgi:Dyp-type peroxidase family
VADDLLELDDIQGLVMRGYGNLRASCYLLLEIGDARAARGWLGQLVGEITAGRVRPERVALNVAFTPVGLRKLGLPPETLERFSTEFVEGVVGPHRSRLLGDVDESAPERWEWGGPGTRAVDVLLMLFARDQATLSEAYLAQRDRMGAAGLVELAKLDTVDLGDREHFGFRDGVSQPVIAGSSRSAAPMHTIRPGEFLLGYPNEHAQVAEGPGLDPEQDPRGLLPRDPNGSGRADLGRNGSYLVFRQLKQDVRRFWHFVDRATRNPDGSGDAAARTWLASKLLGRWPSGAPLALTPHGDDPGLVDSNDFGYHARDREGFGCPIGAHVRRANPRDSLDPNPGSQASIDVGKRHRILRRGREYGQPVDPETLFRPDAPPSDGADEERGLYFVCLCGNIARQFEFVQRTWIMSPKFGGLYDDPDPVVGAHPSGGGTFTVQAPTLRRRFGGLPRFVTVRGGGYFFLPGLRALRYLTNPSPTHPPAGGAAAR